MKKMLLLVAAAAIAAFAAWYSLTQPLFEEPPRATGLPAVDPGRLSAHVKALVKLSPRDAEHVENLNRAATYLFGELERAGGRMTDQVFEADGQRRNVLAAFGPETSTRVVVGAHYDAFGPHPGADDNASGVAVLLELARLLGREGDDVPRLGIEVDLAAYALEEPPYFRSAAMGSAIHAKWLQDAGVNVKAMVCLESVGYFSDAEGSQRVPASLLKYFYPSRGDFIAVVGRLGGGLVRRVKTAMHSASDLPVRSLSAPASVEGVDFSDHLNFWKLEIPAVMVTDTAFLRNDRYHTAQDTSDTLDYGRMAKVVQGVHQAVVALAE